MRRHVGRKNYIMVEFQITIAVLVLMLVIIMPVIYKAKERAKSRICISNLKQCAMGFTFYSEINMDYMPYASGNKYGIPWTLLMISENGSKNLTPKMVSCPVMKKKKKKDTTWWRFQPDYGVNDHLLSSSGNGSGNETGKLPRLSDPSEKLLVTDTWRNSSDGTPQLDSGWYCWDRVFMLNRRNIQMGRPAARHFGNTVPSAFADMHVRLIQIPDRDSPETSPYFNYATPAGRSALSWTSTKTGD